MVQLDLPLEQGELPTGWRVVDAYEGSIGPDPEADSLVAQKKLKAAGVRLIAVRHGESEANRLAKELQTSVFCGSYDSPLTERGRSQAHTAARQVYQQLGGNEWMAEAVKDPSLLPVIYSSPLSRAHDTALATSTYLTQKAYEMVMKGKASREQVLDLAKDLQPLMAPSLKESNFGDFELGLIGEAKAAHPDFVENWDGWQGRGVNFLHRFPNGESRSDVLARVDGFLNNVADEHEGRTVVMFGHHGSILAAKNQVGERTVVDGKLVVNAPEIKNATPIALM